MEMRLSLEFLMFKVNIKTKGREREPEWARKQACDKEKLKQNCKRTLFTFKIQHHFVSSWQRFWVKKMYNEGFDEEAPAECNMKSV